MRLRIAYVISGLPVGGAEIMLFKLLQRLDLNTFDPLVVSLTTIGQIGEKIQRLGIPVKSLGMTKGFSDIFNFLQLIKLLKKNKTDLVHTWMYHADFLGGLAAFLAGNVPVVWGVRNTNLDRDKTSRSMRVFSILNAMLSDFLPSGILFNSKMSMQAHIERGYSASKMAIIPNGFDVDIFKPDELARKSFRSELGVNEDAPLVGIVGRYDPLKNHEGFIEAASLVVKNCPSARFVMVGKGLDPANQNLNALSERLGVIEHIHFLGARNDLPRVMAGFDLLVSTSYGEAFPNVIGEAMLCGVPCIVTDVGDCAWIVSDAGRIVQSGDMKGLADQIISLIDLPKSRLKSLGAAARERIVENFEIGSIVKIYESYYLNMLQR